LLVGSLFSPPLPGICLLVLCPHLTMSPGFHSLCPHFFLFDASRLILDTSWRSALRNQVDHFFSLVIFPVLFLFA
jgi:hypothetical protein